MAIGTHTQNQQVEKQNGIPLEGLSHLLGRVLSRLHGQRGVNGDNLVGGAGQCGEQVGPLEAVSALAVLQGHVGEAQRPLRKAGRPGGGSGGRQLVGAHRFEAAAGQTERQSALAPRQALRHQLCQRQTQLLRA